MTVYEIALLQRAYQLSKDADRLAADFETYVNASSGSILKREANEKTLTAHRITKIKGKAVKVPRLNTNSLGKIV